MASALVNNVAPAIPEGFLDLHPSAAYSCGWRSPRLSLSRDFSDECAKLPGSPDDADRKKPPSQPTAPPAEADLGSPGRDSVGDFEFRRLDDPVTMLPADELFSDGKLVPLQLAAVRATPEVPAVPVVASSAGGRSTEACRLRREMEAIGSDPFSVFSPKAPRCSSLWWELLGLKKATAPQSGMGGCGGAANRLEAQMASSSSPQSSLTAASTTTRNAAAKYLKHFLHRNTKPSSSIDESLNLPLLRDPECGSVSISAGLSLSSSSSSSSGPEHADHPRPSLDSDKPSSVTSISLGRNPPPRVRLSPRPRSSLDPSRRPSPVLDRNASRHLALAASPAAGGSGRSVRSPIRGLRGEAAAAVPEKGTSVDSPRMNSWGKVVFQSPERSSSSPCAFHGNPRVKHRRMERSFSANRVTPVLNVPVCSILGQLFFSPHEKDGGGGLSSSIATRNTCGGGGGTTRGRAAKT